MKACKWSQLTDVIVTSQTSDGMTVLHLAAKAGQTTAIRYLLENRRLNVNAKVELRRCHKIAVKYKQNIMSKI